jgi:hypothetical protein
MMQFIPAAWLELAAANRPMIVYSRTVEFPDSEPEARVLSVVEEMLADLCPQVKKHSACVAA